MRVHLLDCWLGFSEPAQEKSLNELFRWAPGEHVIACLPRAGQVRFLQEKFASDRGLRGVAIATCTVALAGLR